jgi:hypothetical protein
MSGMVELTYPSMRTGNTTSPDTVVHGSQWNSEQYIAVDFKWLTPRDILGHHPISLRNDHQIKEGGCPALEVIAACAATLDGAQQGHAHA